MKKIKHLLQKREELRKNIWAEIKGSFTQLPSLKTQMADSTKEKKIAERTKSKR